MTNKEYKAYCESIRAEAQKAMSNQNAVTSFRVDMAYVRKKGIELFLDLQSERKLHDGVIAAIDGKRNIYSQEYMQQLKKEENTTFEVKAAEIRSKFEEVVNAALVGKKSNINKMLTTPPTQEQLNLLTAIQMRRKELNEGEISHIAPMLVGNYNAFKSLQSLALDSGFNLESPVFLDYEKLSSAIEWSEKYLSERIADFTLPWRQMSPMGRYFFGAEWEDTFYNENAISVLDFNVQLQEPIPIIMKRDLSENEKKILDTMFSGYTPDELKARVLKAAESDELKSLISLHPEYSAYIKSEE